MAVRHRTMSMQTSTYYILHYVIYYIEKDRCWAPPADENASWRSSVDALTRRQTRPQRLFQGPDIYAGLLLVLHVADNDLSHLLVTPATWR